MGKEDKMIDNLNAHGVNTDGLDSGTGYVTPNQDGTFTAFVLLDDNIGVFAVGASEGHALAALEAKLKAVSSLITASYAHAETPYRLRKQKESAEQVDKLMKAIGGGGENPFDLAAPKKPAPGGN